MTGLRVVTYNVRALRDDARAVTRILGTLRPDVACIQESPRYWRWRSRCAWLASRCGLVHVAGGRTTGGTALLVAPRLGVTRVGEHRFTKTPRLHQRGTAVAELRVGETAVVVTSVHFGLDADERLRHLPELTVAVDAWPAPFTVVAGDLNERPDGPVWRALADSYVDAGADKGLPTFPARHPRRRIDGIFVRGEAEVVACWVVDDAQVIVASDHRPVVVDLELRSG